MHSARASPWIHTRGLHCCTGAAAAAATAAAAAAAAAAISHIVKHKDQGRLTLAHSPHLFATRPEAVSLGSDAWTLRAVQRTYRVCLRCQTATTSVGLGVCRNLCTYTKYDILAHEDCLALPSSYVIWKCDRAKISSSKKESQKKTALMI